jgi:beta-lactamase regulating signal transducer with metallopeptidase domain/phage pi2 protein 07
MINLLFNASITGGIVILLWYLSYPLSKKYFKASWHYAVLKITMVFMLIPISILAPIFNNMFAGLTAKPDMTYISEISKQIQVINIDAEKINSVNSALSDFVFPETPPVQYSPPSRQVNNINNNVIEQPDNTIIDIKGTPQIERSSVNIPYLQLIWLIVAIILFSNGIRKMHKFKKQILNNSSSNVDRETQELFMQYKKQLKVRGRITLRTSKYIKTPLVFGLIKPLVIFPETNMNADEKRLALTHEFTHIKNGDLWVKFFAFIISAIHWFNPFTHLLRRKISAVSEEYCDERVVKKMTKEERFSYGNLILKVVCDISAPQSRFCSTLSAPTKNIKRRLSNMINTKKSRKSMIALSVLVALILCSFATMYAFAANTNTPENILPDLPKILAVEPNPIITEKDITDDFPYNEFGGTFCIGYLDSNGEEAFRLSIDGGATWNIQDENDNLILDENVSETEWLTYDEFKAWLDIEKVRLQSLLDTYYYTTVDGVSVYWTQEEIDEQIAYYESGLEDLKNGIRKAGKIIFGNSEEIVFVFTQSTPLYAISYTYSDGETFQTYSQEEMEELLAQYESMACDITSDGVTIYDYIISTPEKTYEALINDGLRVQYPSKTYGYRYTPDDGGEAWGFGAISYKELYELVKEHFDEWIQEGKMTQEEADRKLAEIKNGAYTVDDAERNIIN